MSDSISTDEFKLDPELNLSKEFTSPRFEDWKAQVEKDLKGASYEKKMITKTYEGIDLEPIYTNENLEKLNITDSLPGFENYARGKNVNWYFKHMECQSRNFNSRFGRI